MKKVVALILMLSMLLAGCNTKTEMESAEEENINITNPSYEGAENNMVSSKNTGFELVGEYWKYTFIADGEKYYLAAPDWKGEKPNITDLKDIILTHYGNDYERCDRIDIMNLPDGMKTQQEIGASAISVTRLIYPDFVMEQNKERDEYKAQSDNYCYNECIKDGAVFREKCDVACLTVALYEGFYEDVKGFNIKLYGVSDKVINSYGGEIASYKLKKELDENKVELNLLLDKDIAQSGAYYIDFNELKKGEEYTQIMCVVTFDETSLEQGCVLESYNYVMDKENLYLKWKENNREKFLY